MSNTRADRASAATSSLAIVGAFACLACTLLLIAATIILALIPVFVPNASATSDDAATRSGEVQLRANIQEDTSGSRKRATANDSLVGCTLDSNGTSVINSFILKHLPTSIVRGLTISNATIVEHPADGVHTINILMFVLFKPTCLYTCQLKNAEALRSRLQNKTENSTSFNFGHIQFHKNGQPYKLLKILGIGISFISLIYPGILGSGGSGYYIDSSNSTSSNSSNSTSG